MIKKIDDKNKIFKSEEFLKDRFRFNILVKIYHVPEAQIYSDEENYVLVRSSEQHPTWIWTKDNIDVNLLP